MSYTMKRVGGPADQAVFSIERDGEEVSRGSVSTMVLTLFVQLDSLTDQKEEAFKQLNELRNRVFDTEQMCHELKKQLDEQQDQSSHFDELGEIARDINRNQP